MSKVSLAASPASPVEEGEPSIGEHIHPRRCSRQSVRLRVDVQSKRFFTAWTHNLSNEGVCFEIPGQLDPGREITMWLYLEEEEEDLIESPIQARCRIVWHDPTPSGSRHGGHFLYFAKNGKQRLCSWLNGDGD